MAAGRGEPGGIWQLLDLIEEHRPAFEYDWRARFHLPLSALPEAMGWDEAIRLTRLLFADPGSRVYASVNGWEYPLSFEGIALAELVDRFTRVNFKKPAPFPRPWPLKERTRTKPSVSQAEVLAALRFAGHTKELPAA